MGKFISLLIALCVAVSIKSCKQKEESKVHPAVIDAPFYFGTYQIPADNPATADGVALGRMLFYETKLSGNNTMSCASCHKQEHAFSDNNTFSIGIDGIKGTRQSMSLTNLLWQKEFFWDGRTRSLEEQALIPIQNPMEMHQTLEATISKLQASANYPALFQKAFGTEQITSALIAKALAQFERTIISSGSRYDAYINNKAQNPLTAQELNGMNLFFTHPSPENGLRGANCGDCHAGSLTFGSALHNNGLDSTFKDLGLGAVTSRVNDNGKFKTPALRNIALTAPYMHDGRFQTLEEVLDHYNEHVLPSATVDPLLSASNKINGKSLMLTAQEKADVIAFLKTLTDNSIITNPKLSSPF